MLYILICIIFKVLVLSKRNLKQHQDYSLCRVKSSAILLDWLMFISEILTTVSQVYLPASEDLREANERDSLLLVRNDSTLISSSGRGLLIEPATLLHVISGDTISLFTTATLQLNSKTPPGTGSGNDLETVTIGLGRSIVNQQT